MLLRRNFPTIVMLHYVSDDPAHDDLRPWNISRSSFTRLLDFLQQENCRTLVFEDIDKGKRRAKSIIITFDDCPKLLWDFAIPELLKRNMKAVFYIPTAQLGGFNHWNVVEGKPRMDLMDGDDVKKLIEVGMEVGSHAHDHIVLRGMDGREVARQLTLSKSILESIIMKPVISVAYPYGSVPVNAKRITKEAGYRFGVAVKTTQQTRYAIRRWIYDDMDNTGTLRWKMSRAYTWYRDSEDKTAFLIKRLSQQAYRFYAGFKNILRANFTLIILLAEDTQYI